MLKRLMIVLLLGITLHADGKEMIQHTQNTTHELLPVHSNLRLESIRFVLSCMPMHLRLHYKKGYR